MITILIFIIILGILILSHEFGHFITAKRSGVKVDEFGFGFPPRLFGKKIGETLYSINLIPFGGFVKIEGEDGEHPEDPKSFTAKPKSIQAMVLAAGVLCNIILAWILFSFVSFAGTPTHLDEETPPDARDIRVVIGVIASESPAEKAGLLAGDVIVSLKAADEVKTVNLVSDIQEFVRAHKGEVITVTIIREGSMQDMNVYARPDPPEGEGALGVSLIRIGIIPHPWYKALWNGLVMTGRSIYFTLLGFYELLQLAFSGANIGAYVAGPVGIVSLVDQSLGLGMIFLLQFTALLSINLAIINLIPFPALDGCRLFFLFIETIIRKPLNKKFTATANAAGFAILLAIMILITIGDVRKLF